MTVHQLRDTLTQLVSLLRAAGAKQGMLDGLAEFVEATAPFGELTTKAFVKLAEAGRTPPAPRPGPKSKADPGAVAAEVKDLYGRAADPTVTEEQVRLACGRLGGLTKDALVKLADGIELFGMKAKKKDDIVRDITNRVLDRKGAAVRRTLIDRPAADQAAQPAVLG